MSETAFAADVTELGDKLAGLTLVKAVELKNYLKTLGIEPAAGVAVAAAAAAPTEVVKKEEQTEFTVILESFDAAKKISVIKVVRELTGLGLGEAKAFVEGAPKPVKENIPKADAEKIKKQIEDNGGKAVIK